MRSASVTPKTSTTMFAPLSSDRTTFAPGPDRTTSHGLERPASNISKRRAETIPDEFDDDGIDDEELVKASCVDLDFDHIDNFANPVDAITQKNTAKNGPINNNVRVKQSTKLSSKDNQEPRQLDNGKWACNHPCKDKGACKHLCCKEGMEKPRKKAIPKNVPATQTKLQLAAPKRKLSNVIEELDLTQRKRNKPATRQNSAVSSDYGDFGFDDVLAQPEWTQGGGQSAEAMVVEEGAESIRDEPENFDEDEEVRYDDNGLNPLRPDQDVVPEAWRDLSPWLFREFGGIVDIVE